MSQHRAKGIGFGFCQTAYTRPEFRNMLMTIQVTPKMKIHIPDPRLGDHLVEIRTEKYAFVFPFHIVLEIVFLSQQGIYIAF